MCITCRLGHEFFLFQNDIKERAKQLKNEWWAPNSITDMQIVDNFNPIVSVPKEKKEGGGTWPANVKVQIPLDDNGEPKDCRIVDGKNNNISIHELPGRKWDIVLIEISGLYFQNKFSWGFGPKKLRLIKVQDTGLTGTIDYFDLILNQKVDDANENPTQKLLEEKISVADEPVAISGTSDSLLASNEEGLPVGGTEANPPKKRKRTEAEDEAVAILVKGGM